MSIEWDKLTGEVLSKDLKVEVRVRDGETKPVAGDIEQAMIDAGWSDDPGTGHAIILENGQEVLNPEPHAPPIGYTPEKSVMEMIDEMLKKRLALLNGEDEIDTAEELEDYGEDDEPAPWSPYEVLLVDEYPAIPNVPSADGEQSQAPSPTPAAPAE